MSYKLVVKGRGFGEFCAACKDGVVKPGCNVYVGAGPLPKRYFFIDGESMKAIDDPVLALSVDMEEVIGNRRWRVKEISD